MAQPANPNPFAEITDDIRRATACLVQMRAASSGDSWDDVFDALPELASVHQVLSDIVHQMRVHLAALAEL